MNKLKSGVILAVIFVQQALASPLVFDQHLHHQKISTLRAQSDCRQQLTSSNGTISSPNYPDSYPNNAVCTWEIIAPAGQTINLTFTDFHLEISPDCTADYVDIFDGEKHQVYCGRETPPVIESVANQVSIVLVTDELINVGNRFSADYVFLEDGDGGEEGLTEFYYVDLSEDTYVYGFFSSPNHPDTYPKDALVRYDLLKGEGASLAEFKTKIGFLRFDTEFTPDSRDSVDIYQSGAKLISLSGSYQFEEDVNVAGLPVFQAIDSNISVVFQSQPDGAVYPGYLFAFASEIPPNKEELTMEEERNQIEKNVDLYSRYEEYKDAPVGTKQTITIDLGARKITSENEHLQSLAWFESRDDELPYGFFMSPNHPKNYDDLNYLQYRLLAAEGERVAIYFPRFVTELDYDGLVLADGIQEIVLTGEDPWDRVFLSSSREVNALFLSDILVQYSGFLAAFASVRILPTET